MLPASAEGVEGARPRSSVPSPIQNPDAFDIIGERNERGVDLVIVCASRIDGPTETVRRLDTKLRNYLAAATGSRCKATFPAAAAGPTAIFVTCECGVSDEAPTLINELADLARTSQIEVLVASSIE